MTVLKSKVALFDWYMGLKTNLRTNKITAIEFEKEVIDTIVAFFEGKKEITPTKAGLIADILNAVGYDHLFTKNWTTHLAYVLGESGATTNAIVQTALDNFTEVQVKGHQRKEKGQAVKPEEKKVFACFPTKAEIESWVSVNKPAFSAVAGHVPNISWQPDQNENVRFFTDVEKYLTLLKQGLDRNDPNYIDNLLIIDYFVSLISTLDIPEQSYQRLVEELRILHADPVKTLNIDAFVERGVSKQKQPSVQQLAIARATAWHDKEVKDVKNGGNILQRLADNYCPVEATKQHARYQLFEFVAAAVKRVLIAIANPNNPTDMGLLAKGHAIDILSVKHGVIGIDTTITKNGVVKLRIFAERKPGEGNVNGLKMAIDTCKTTQRYSTWAAPMPELIDKFINMWDIPAQPSRFAGDRDGHLLPMHAHGLIEAVMRETAEHGITPTYGTIEDSIIIFLH